MNNFGIQETLAIAGLVLTILGGLDVLIRWYFNSHIKALREMTRHLQGQIEQLNQQLIQRDERIVELLKQVRSEDWISPHAQSLLDEQKSKADRLSSQLTQVKQQLEEVQALFARAETSHAELQHQLKQVNLRYQQARTLLDQYEKSDRSKQRLVERTLRLEGKVWLQDILHGAHPFISLSERKTPIISMLNLKGGVGKTTLTAYLAWAMVRKGYRVLLVDLDLQGSLSSLFLSEPQLKARHDNQLLLRDYLAHAAREKHSRLDAYVTPVEQLAGKADLLATTDKLGYEEMNLTFQWLFRIGRAGNQWSGRRDVRLLLRRALHRKGLKKRYDLVLFDCPPLVNLCCVNALAASDYILVPVTPSRKALERVPSLLGKVKEIIEKVNRELGILGIVANRTQWKDAMTPTEKDMWTALPQHCLDVFSMPVHLFETFLPHRVLIRDAEANFPPVDDQDIQATIDKLAGELESRLPLFCRPTQEVKQGGLFGATEVAP